MVKSGWKTSEFWVSMATAAFGVLVTLGVVTPEMASEGTQAVGQIVGGVIILAPIIDYIWSRTQVKKNGAK